MLPKRFLAAAKFFAASPINHNIGQRRRIVGTLKLMPKLRVAYCQSGIDPQLDVAQQFEKLVAKFRFKNAITTPYFYPLDPQTRRVIPGGTAPIVSLTLDNAKILTLDLNQLSTKLSGDCDTFSVSIVRTIKTIDFLRRRAIKYYQRQGDGRANQICQYLERLMDTTPQSLDEALQKILFFNALLWSSEHRHIGLGRLDLILQPYLDADISNGTLSVSQAKAMVRDFVVVLSGHTVYKSVGLIGDTGQVILLSGTDASGRYVENDLTHMFIEIIEELNIPDPKLILRVCPQTTPQLWQRAIRCVARGNGSPLMANEPKIMALMEQFGYEKSDVVDFGTSACWEPLIVGKSFDQNNSIENINIPQIVSSVVNSQIFESYADFQRAILEAITKEVSRIAGQYKTIKFDRSPIHSIWMDGCVESLTDISQGGAKYNFHGFLATGLPNAVNSLLNIEEFVFNRKELSYAELRDVLRNNFEGHEPLRARLMANGKKFGLTDIQVIDLSNRLMSAISEEIEKTTVNGNKAKVGFSSPGYLMCAVDTPATADGRRRGEPFATHISPVGHEIDFAQIIDFAAALDYSGNKINGNVVDFILSDQYAKNADKFAHILSVAFNKGVFEMQLNVLNLDQLLAAKANPALYPSLVVRVWGFSAYFNDLPESYKDHLIERAKAYAA